MPEELEREKNHKTYLLSLYHEDKVNRGTESACS